MADLLVGASIVIVLGVQPLLCILDSITTVSTMGFIYTRLNKLHSASSVVMLSAVFVLSVLASLLRMLLARLRLNPYYQLGESA
jgi:hypothetical protein